MASSKTTLRPHLPRPYWLAGLAGLVFLGTLAALAPPALVIGLVLVFAGLVVLVSRPALVLLALLLGRSFIDGARDFYIFFPGTVYSFNLAGLFNIIGVGLAAYFLLRRLLRGDRLLPSAVLIAYAGFLLVGAVGIFGSVDPAASIKDWSRLAGSLGIVLLALEVASQSADQDETRRITARIITLVAVLPLAFGYYQALTGTGYYFPGYQGTEFALRPLGTFGHPAVLASFLVLVATLLAAAYALKWQLWPRPVVYAFGGLYLGLLVFTYARTEWLGGLVALGIIALLRFKRLLLAGAIGIALIFLAVPTVRERLTGQQAGESWAWRQDVWDASLYWAESAGPAGHGLDTSPQLLNWRLPHVDSPPHNDYLRVLVEAGFLGLLAFLTWQFALIHLGWRSFRRRPEKSSRVFGLTLAAMTVGGVVISFADNYLSYTSIQWYLWTIAGLLIAANYSRT